MKEIIGRLKRHIIQPLGKLGGALSYQDSLSAIGELNFDGRLDPRALIFLRDFIVNGSVVNFAKNGGSPLIGLDYFKWLKQVDYDTRSVRLALNMLAERTDRPDAVLGPETSGSRIGKIFTQETEIPCIPIYKTPEGEKIPDKDDFIGGYVPSYTRPGQYDLMRLKIRDLLRISSNGSLYLKIIEDTLDTRLMVEFIWRACQRLNQCGFNISLDEVFALFDKDYMRTQERKSVEKHSIRTNAVLTFTDMAIAPARFKIKEDPRNSFRTRNA